MEFDFFKFLLSEGDDEMQFEDCFLLEKKISDEVQFGDGFFKFF